MPTKRSQNCKRVADGEDGPPAKRKHSTNPNAKVPAPLSGAARQSQQTPRPPSEHWGPFDPTSAPEPLRRVISTASWPFLCDLAVKHHPSKSGAISCTANLERLARGFFNVAIELSFSDGTFWIARIRIPPKEPEEEDEEVEEEESKGEKKDEHVKEDEEKGKAVERVELEREREEGEEGDDDHDDTDDDELESKIEMLSEIATMRLVAQRTPIPVPEVYCYDWTQNNPFGFPYILMSALPGKSLRIPLAFAVPKDSQPKFAAQMADYILQLSKITFSEIGQIWTGEGLDEKTRIIPFQVYGQDIGPFNSSTAYFRGMQQATNEAIRERHEEEEDWPQWHQFCKIETNVIPFLTSRQLRHGPFPLWHTDFHYKNILVDDEYNITGVLDWTGVSPAPWEEFVVYCDMLVFGGVATPRNQPTVDFRGRVIEALRNAERERGQTARLTTPTVSDLMDSGVVDVIDAWRSRAPKSVYALRNASRLLRLLFGEETTLDNWKVRQRKLARRFPWQ